MQTKTLVKAVAMTAALLTAGAALAAPEIASARPHHMVMHHHAHGHWVIRHHHRVWVRG